MCLLDEIYVHSLQAGADLSFREILVPGSAGPSTFPFKGCQGWWLKQALAKAGFVEISFFARFQTGFESNNPQEGPDFKFWPPRLTL